MRAHNKYNTHAKPYIGVQITNNGTESQNVEFLNVLSSPQNHSSIELKNLFQDRVFDDNSLTMLKGWIMSVGYAYVSALVFNTQNLFEQFLDKTLEIKKYSLDGNYCMMPLDMGRYLHPSQLNINVIRVELAGGLILDSTTEFRQTNIKPGEIFTIIFYLGEELIDSVSRLFTEARTKFSKDKQRKILLLL